LKCEATVSHFILSELTFDVKEYVQIFLQKFSMGPGTLYGVLRRMQNDGLIIMAEDNRRRKIYRITAAGEATLQGEYQRLTAMVRDGEIIRGNNG
jgi:DNA-binding PadR family transcriptional regulator